MSWLFSRALVEAFSEGTSSDGEQSAQSSGNPMQLAYLPPDRMTAFSRLSRFGMTFRPLTDDRGEELLMSYLAASRARTSAWPAKAQESTESGQECGPTWRGSLARFDPATSSWRTAQPSLLEDLGESSVTWPRSGMTAGGQCWELPMSGRRISGTGFGLLLDKWPTPTASSNGPGKDLNNPRGIHQGNALATAVVKRMWPTPLASDGTKCSSDSLTRAVRPDLKKSFRSKASQTWATPTATDYKGSPSLAHVNERSEMYSRGVRLPEQIALRTQQEVGGALNPDWVEWLMNWPITWSSFNAVNQEKFQRWQETSAAALQESGQLRTMWWDRDPSQAPSGQQPDEQPEQELGDSLQKMPRITARQPEVEGSHEGSDLPLLRDGLHLQASQREDMQQGMREQAGMDEAQIVPRVASGVVARVDRLKAIGNGQVPAVAATAWRLLA